MRIDEVWFSKEKPFEFTFGTKKITLSVEDLRDFFPFLYKSIVFSHHIALGVYHLGDFFTINTSLASNVCDPNSSNS